MTGDISSEAFFESMYRREADPWHFASSGYELGRYRAILAALGERRFARAFEPGCSVGVLTEGLAQRCDAVEAMDISPSAIETARHRCRLLQNVHLTCGSFENAMPGGTFDLIVLSEIGYYFDETVLERLAKSLMARLASGGVLLGAHWLGESSDHVLSGDKVHEILHRLRGLTHERGKRHPGFRFDIWRKR